LRLNNKNFFVLLIEKPKIKGPRPTPTKVTKPEACSKLCPSLSSPHLKQQKIIQKITPFSTRQQQKPWIYTTIIHLTTHSLNTKSKSYKNAKQLLTETRFVAGGEQGG
jgi:hypothetical protein